MEPSQTVEVSKRDDPRYDARRVVVYFVGLIAFYAGVVAVMRPDEGEISKVALGIMFAPTVGAIAAVLFAHGRIQFGRLSKHIFLAFLPPLVILATAWAASVFTDVTVHPENLLMVVVLSPVFALGGALSAIGEEIGWRGFLWPLLRGRVGVLDLQPGSRRRSGGSTTCRWCIFGWLRWGPAHLPAFTVAIVGISAVHRGHHRPVAVAVAQRHHPRGVERAGRQGLLRIVDWRARSRVHRRGLP